MLGVLIGFTLGSCTDEYADMPERGAALTLCPMLNETDTGGELTLTRADESGNTKTDENIVSKMDVYIFKNADGSFIKAYHLNSVTSMAGVQNVLDANWPAVYTVGTAYDVYVIANNPETSPASFADRNELLNYKVLNHNGIAAPATLLMDGYKLWTPASASDQFLNNVILTRAAAKLDLTVTVGPNLARKLRAASTQVQRPLYRIVNYNVNTGLGFTGSAAAPRNLKIRGGWLENTSQNTDWITPDDPDGANPQELSYNLVAYSYSFSWTEEENLLLLPKMLVSFGFKETSATNPSYHYYLLPMVAANLGNKSLARNHIYLATATIDDYGSTEEVVDNVDNDIDYEVLEWGSPFESQVTAANVKYFKVMPDNPVIYEGDPQAFRSATLYYAASDNIRITNVESYYYNKNGVKTTFPDVAGAGLDDDGDNDDHYSWALNTSDNTITVNSMVPICAAVKYIKFTVEMVDENGAVISDSNKNPLRKEIIVKHFPANYVVNIEGLWASRTTDGWVRWGDGITRNRTASDNHFNAKVYNSSDGRIYYIARNNSLGNRLEENSSNNHIYVIQTKSIDWNNTTGKPREVLAKPIVSDNLSEDDVISPAFMVASQLSATHAGWASWETSIKNHCSTLMEVTKEGKIFKNWRLPTRLELRHSVTYSEQYGLVMVNLFNASAYWALDGNKRQRSGPLSTSTTMAAHIRCVRDLTPDDIRYVNGEMTQAEINDYLNVVN